MDIVFIVKRKSIKVNEMKEEKQIGCLAFFEYNINGETFKELFQKAGGSERMANHLWDKFCKHDQSFLRTLGFG